MKILGKMLAFGDAELQKSLMKKKNHSPSGIDIPDTMRFSKCYDGFMLTFLRLLGFYLY